MNERWTPRDQAQLDDLTEKRKRTYDRDREALLKLVMGTMELQSASLITFELIKHADAVRDALEPFDSGVRAVCTPSMQPLPAARRC